MADPRPIRRLLTTAVFTSLVFGIGGTAGQRVGGAELLRIGKPPIGASFAGIDPNGSLQFRGSDGSVQRLNVEELVRWSNPAARRSGDALLLTDGSVLALAPSWSRPSITFEDPRGEARTSGLGRIEFQRRRVRAVLFHMPRDEDAIARRIDETADPRASGDRDQLLLTNGDVVEGSLVSIGASTAGGGEAVMEGDVGRVEVPLERISGILFADGSGNAPEAAEAPPKKRLLVGLDDGSQVIATRIRAEGEQLVVDSASAGPLTLAEGRRLVMVQNLGGRVAYLSDQRPTAYRHEPYLDLPWQFARDRNVLARPLRAGQQAFLKGIGMHSAARLTFDLDGGYQRFAATVTLDDAADGRGSVVFRVFLRVGDQWQEAFASGVVYGGDPPREVSVDLAQATQLALVVDYADRGDERDYADWLDARLEQTQTD